MTSGGMLERPRGRVGASVSLGLFYVGLCLLYLPIPLLGGSVGAPVVEAGLFLSIAIAPLEYAPGAISFAFLAASSYNLSGAFLDLRWAFLAAAAAILPIRFFLRSRVSRPATPNRFAYFIAVFVVVSGATLATTLSIRLTILKLGALVCLFFVASQTAGRLIDSYGPAAPRRFVFGLLAYPAGLVVLSAAAYFLSFGRTVSRNGWFTGFLFHPNAWGLLMLIVLPGMVAPLLRKSPRSRPRQLALLFGVLLVGYTLPLSASRAALLGALIAVTLFCFIHANRKLAAMMALVTVFFTVRSLAQPDYVKDLVGRFVYKHSGRRDDAFQSRAEPWKAARQNFVQRPWLGMGFGVTSEAQSEWTMDTQTGVGVLETGSSFWSALIQIGILGSSALFLALLGLLLQGARFAWKVKDPWFTAIYGSTVALTMNALFEGWLLAPGNYAGTYYWIQCFFLNAMMCRFQPASVRRLQFVRPQADGNALVG